MPADMAISSAPAPTGEKCQVRPRRRDRGVNDILSNYLSPLHRPGIGTWGDHMRQAITWKKIPITGEVERASHCPPPPNPTSTLPPAHLSNPGLYFLKWRGLKHCGIYSVNTLILRETSWKGYFQGRNQSQIYIYKWDLRGNTICAGEMDYLLSHGRLIQRSTLISGGRREVLTQFDREHI